mmetsp:Transcript_69510/g.176395  ORF Transcript_69510/g.176395 Transcript_69510/m.176395 type:complete len:332 (+) Transcript_69510:69-1064(+)|eukprot:CAMPEP_0183396106 /NCGR_PEP_ID=MMETSP0370-20130417/9790_1 /TAXON_ID=268820 /ORGANISM="Peridinium aciculiferum, Strain PAER-2" /LENGTH=331 /DNA_ID=CAMNT_0025576849 /DNA_START=58 /DNA_END=1053 /DNA_ORIENTATION=+
MHALSYVARSLGGSAVPCRQQLRFAGGAVASGIRPGDRLAGMRKMLAAGKFIRVVEVHSGFSAIVADRARAVRPDGTEATFDMVWSSSLTSSSIKGKPDIETVDTTERCQIVEDVLEVCDKPMIYDGDTGGEKEIFHFTVRRLERLGVSAIVIEDKRGLKQNSLFGTERAQQLEDIDVFCDKIRAGKKAQVTEEFMIFARLEALIAGLGEDEAMKRAHAYVRKGGADGIMIHSKEKDPSQIFSFIERYRKEEPNVPIVVVPTTYNSATEAELEKVGANICIYANQLIRASYLAMLDTANQILKAGRSKEVDGQILPTKEMITLIDDNSSSK